MYKEKKHLGTVGLLKDFNLPYNSPSLLLTVITVYRSIITNTLKTTYHRFPGLRSRDSTQELATGIALRGLAIVLARDLKFW